MLAAFPIIIMLALKCYSQAPRMPARLFKATVQSRATLTVR